MLSAIERREAPIRWSVNGVHLGAAAVFLLVVGLGPLLWLAKASVSTTQDTLRHPMALFPSGVDLENITTAWTDAQIGHYFWNTVKVAIGSWLVQLVVAVTGGYVLGILKPWYARFVTVLVVATLFIPPVVLLVPLFLTVLDLPFLGTSLLNNYWALWLPAGASAFNVLLVKRFFENIPIELLEAARVDGADRSACCGRSCCRCPADHRRRVGVRHPRRLEGLPLAAGRAPRADAAAAVGAPADRPPHAAARRLPRRPADPDRAPGQPVPRLPALRVPRRRSQRRRQGIAAASVGVSRNVALGVPMRAAARYRPGASAVTCAPAGSAGGEHPKGSHP